ncbi:MAG: CBS domain-containing protein [Vicingaceae bacterium]
MLAKDLISEEIPALKPSDSVEKALGWMEEFKLTEIPLVVGSTYQGLISEGDLLDVDDSSISIKEAQAERNRIFVTEYEHIYEVIGKMAGQQLSILPVISDDKQYIGAICLNTLVEKISNLGAMKDPGGIITLEMNVNDYTLSEISNIVESNGAKILSSYIATHDDSNKMDVTIKINRTDLSAIIQTFERYNYAVVASFHKSEMEDDMKRRYDAFLHYLNM